MKKIMKAYTFRMYPTLSQKELPELTKENECMKPRAKTYDNF